MNIKELYHRFRSWQQNPFHYERSNEKHVCANCGQEFEGNFCPTCGQSYNVGSVNWSSVGKEFIKAWGIETKSLVSSVVQIFGRPGYLIGDYLNGRRQVCYSPISMLFILAMIGMLILRLTGLDGTEKIMSADIENEVAKQVLMWILSHFGWCILLETVFLILPTWLLFRHSPKHTHHTIPEGIYIQLMMGSIVIVFTMASEAVYWLTWGVPIYYFIAYRQLFGYGFWGTLWRTAIAIFEGLSFIILLAFVVASIFMKEVVEDRETLIALIIFYSVIFALNLGILYIGNRISKKSAVRRLLKEKA